MKATHISAKYWIVVDVSGPFKSEEDVDGFGKSLIDKMVKDTKGYRMELKRCTAEILKTANVNVTITQENWD